MNIFIDTAAFLAIQNANDQFHHAAWQSWEEMLHADFVMFSSYYVL